MSRAGVSSRISFRESDPVRRGDECTVQEDTHFEISPRPRYFVLKKIKESTRNGRGGSCRKRANKNTSRHEVTVVLPSRGSFRFDRDVSSGLCPRLTLYLLSTVRSDCVIGPRTKSILFVKLFEGL